jgi:PIN domain nuclease of toxin-antitoxin system
MIVLDTHAWIWHLADPAKLSRRGRALIADERENRRLRVSSISVWELLMLLKKGRLELSLSPSAFLQRAQRLSCIDCIPIDNDIARVSADLPDIHEDPADRLILAAASELGCAVLSKDGRLAASGTLPVAW